MSANSKAIKKDSRFDAYDNVKSKSRRLIETRKNSTFQTTTKTILTGKIKLVCITCVLADSLWVVAVGWVKGRQRSPFETLLVLVLDVDDTRACERKKVQFRYWFRLPCLSTRHYLLGFQL